MRPSGKGARPAVFLDRDGTLVRSTHLLTNPNELELEPSAVRALVRLRKLNLPLVVVTNQPQVARGLCSEDDIRNIHRRLDFLLEQVGCAVDAYYFCPHHPEVRADIPPHAIRYRIHCECRKPGIGMLRAAALDLGLDLSRSFLVGDRTVDLEAARNAGCMGILVLTGEHGGDGQYGAAQSQVAQDLEAAAAWIESWIQPRVRAVILAGGKGTRFQKVLSEKPKSLVEIGGRSAIEHQLLWLKQNGVSDVTICTGYLGCQIRDSLGDGSRLEMRINFSHEGSPLGTAGALKHAEPQFGEANHLLVLNGDLWIELHLASLINFHLRKRGMGVLVLRRTQHPWDSDVVRLSGDRIVEFVGRGQRRERLANTGIILLHRDFLQLIPAGFSTLEKDVICSSVTAHRFYGYETFERVFDFGTPDRFRALNRMLLR